ncbi:threonine ammonia-lyase [Amnibacterium setariae]|uniref:L-threonine dehydratase catabolic TdcB n=1 Tax=Amnibacterium setariae TaxID=2306585 RepID=A0A3A1U3F9_9MICO|nr:threonine ammonia-lyase [Amnibacterium setariae]RIX31404.1 threonine ammonia-lyase [Amnibacterium setariae]
MTDTTDAPVAPSIERIRDAARFLAPVAARTPMEHSRFLASITGSAVHLKCENLQRTGSYKIRGASYRLSRLSPEERARGVVAASAGNHAQGVAFAARELGIAATIFMPNGVALPKLEATRDYGARVELVGDVVDEALAAAKRYAEETGAVFIPPFDHPDVIAGQGTVGLEILEDVPEVRTIVVPIGGGGLIAGVAAAVKQLAPHVRIIGVQAENAAAFPTSLEAGEVRTVATRPTIADGIAVGTPGRLTFQIVRDLVDDVVTVSDDETASAMLVLLERAKLVVEPAGAVGVAAILSGRIPDPGSTVAVLSGGNIDPLMMERVISRGLVASDRYMTLRIGLPDRPGQLAVVSSVIAEANANVVEVLHTRHGTGTQISEVQIDISVETRGKAHQAALLERLRSAGFAPQVVEA